MPCCVRYVPHVSPFALFCPHGHFWNFIFFFLPLILFVLRNEWWVVLDLRRTKREQWSWPINNGVWTGYCTRVPLCFPTCLHLSWHATDTRSTSPSLFSKLLPFFHDLALTLIGLLYIFMACDAMMLKSVKTKVELDMWAYWKRPFVFVHICLHACIAAACWIQKVKQGWVNKGFLDFNYFACSFVVGVTYQNNMPFPAIYMYYMNYIYTCIYL